MGPRLPRNPHVPKGKKKDMGGPDEQTVNNPVAIADRNGDVHFVYCVEYMRCFYMRSGDDGRTWARPVELTAAFEAFRPECDWQAMAAGPGHGIQLRNDCLVVPVWIATYADHASLTKASAVVFSDNGGATWQAGGIAIRGAVNAWPWNWTMDT